MGIFTYAPLEKLNVQIVPKEWKAAEITEFNLNSGATILKSISNNNTVNIYIGTINVGTEGALAHITLTFPNLTKMTQSISSQTPNVNFDLKEGIVLAPGNSINITLESLDTSSQKINISYIWAF